MTIQQKPILCLLIIILLLIGTISAQEDEAQKATLVKVGQVAPDFSFTTLDGNDYSILGLKGKVVLVNFFATWCPPCKKEMPHLENEIFNKIKDDDFFMVSVGREHKKEELVEFKAKKKVSFPFAPDPERKIFRLYAKSHIPRNVVIGKDGKIKFLSIGFEEKEFAEMISLIKEELGK